MVKIELIMDEEKQCFLNVLKKKLDELVVPLDKWDLYIKDNPRIKPDQMPEFAISGAYVITERDAFSSVVNDLGYLFYMPKRLSKEQGGFWFAEKLEPKKKMPKHDIFDVGLRQPGSFRS